MKLRLRSVETQATHKLDLPHTSSLQHLKESLSHAIGSPSDSIHLSLNRNRKDQLVSSSPQDSLRSLGLISGDLLFFSLNTNSFISQTLIPPQPLLSNNQTFDDKNNNNDIKEEALNSNTQKAGCSNSDTGGTSKNTIDLDTQDTINMETNVNLNTQNEGDADLDTQVGESGESMDVDDEGPVFRIGKSFSVPSFLRKVFNEELGDDGGNHHKLLTIAVHAVMLESGFLGYDPVANLMIHGFDFPEKWPSSAFIMSLCYTLPEVVNFKGDGTYTVVLKFQSVGKFFNVYGSLATGSTGSTGSGTHWVCVNEDQLVPFLNLIWANCGPVTETNEKGGAFSISPAREVFTFWRTVKDKLALPLLIDLCDKAGLDLPPCFMRLPTDVMLQIVGRLPGVDVAKVGSVCLELRYLTSSDDLWKQKFVEQFGDAEKSEGGAHWKEKFARAFESRKRRRKMVVDTSLMRMERHPFLLPLPAPSVPFPGIVGGDYDILPNVFQPIHQPRRGNPRFRNLLPHCNLGGLGELD